MGQSQIFDNVLVQEYIREGQRVAEWSFDAWVRNSWKELAHAKTIGYKHIECFEPVTVRKVRLNIIRSWDEPMISNFGFFLSCIPEDIITVYDDVIKGMEPEYIERTEFINGLKYTYYTGEIHRGTNQKHIIE